MSKSLKLLCVLILVIFTGLRFGYIATSLAQQTASKFIESALVHEQNSDLPAALRDYHKAISIEPQNLTAYYRRGVIYRDLDDLEKAISDFSKVIAGEPQNAGAYINRGFTYATGGDVDRAISDFTKAIQIDPQEAAAYVNRGAAHLNNGDREAAIEDFTKAIQIEPQGSEALGFRGLALLEAGDITQAIADLEKATRLDPSLDYAASRLEDARETLTAQALRTEPEPSTAVGSRRVALVIGNGQYQAAGDVLHNAEDDARDVAKALADRGYDLYGDGPQLNLTLNQFDKVIEGFKNASIGADDAVVWYAGHGQQFAEENGVTSNWLIPVDAEVKSVNDLRRRTIKLSSLFDTVEPANKLRLVIIDACRNSSFKTETKRGSVRGFGRVERPGLILVFSTKPGTTADDGKKEDRNSPFATAFLESLKSYSDQYVTQFLGGVAGKTSQLTNRVQRPEVISDIQTGDHLAL